MKRKHKIYARPKKPFDKQRILEEKEIVTQYGLKNKREIWKAAARIKTFREQAKDLIKATPKEQQAFFTRLQKLGLPVKSLAEVLSLEARDYLARRLQTIIVTKKIASTPKGARQLITHRKVLVDGAVVDSPSYLVPVELESTITLKNTKKKKEVVKE